MCDSNFIRKECNYKNDYQCQRKCNISKLKELYDTELQNYYTTYNEYLKYKYDRSSNQALMRARAESELRPKVVRINNRLNKVLTDLKSNIEYTQDLIKKQENGIKVKNNLIYRRNTRLSKQNDMINGRSDELVTKERQIETGGERNSYKRLSMYVLIILNIVAIIFLMKYLMK